MDDRWVEVATLDDLPPGGSLEFRHEGRAFALFRSRSGEVVTCLDGLCPHDGGRLSLGPFDGASVTCPRRGCLRWSFDVRTGACPIGPSLTRRLHPTRLDGNAVFVALPEG